MLVLSRPAKVRKGGTGNPEKGDRPLLYVYCFLSSYSTFLSSWRSQQAKMEKEEQWQKGLRTQHTERERR